jgi:exonuclease III
LKINSQDFTYSSYKPQKSFDLFLVPKSWNTETKIFKEAKFSDHLPIILEIKKRSKRKLELFF